MTINILPKAVVALAACLAIQITPMLAAPGDLDPTFGSGGKVTTDIGSGNDYVYSVAVQSDGKIVVAGSSNNGSRQDFALARYQANGSLDTTFGSGGKVTTPVGSGDSIGNCIAVQSDGKIVVAGRCYNPTDLDFALVRYQADGTLDTAFGSGGKVTTDISGGFNDVGRSVAVQSDGKIVVAGFSNNSTNQDFALVRYQANGTLDLAFGNQGKVTMSITGRDYGQSVAVQSDGKILLAGSCYEGAVEEFALVRFQADGKLDATFGSGGKSITSIGGIDDFGESVAVQSNGKIVVAGSSYNGINGEFEFALVRYQADGAPDTTFGSSGKVTTDISSSLQDVGCGVAVQSDGKTLVAGFSGDGTNVFFALAVYQANGSLDSTFGSGGKVITSVGSGTSAGATVHSLGAQRSERLIEIN